MIRRTRERRMFCDGNGAVSALERVEEECLLSRRERKAHRGENGIARLVHLWLDSGFMETNIVSYRKRACSQVGEQFGKKSLLEILQEETARLEVSLRRCPNLRGLFDEPFDWPLTRASEREKDNTAPGSEYFHVALSSLARRSRKRKAIARIEDRFSDSRTKSVSRPGAYPGCVRMSKRIPYPLSSTDLCVLNANEEETVGIQACVYERYIRTTLSSRGKSPRLLAPVLQQAITLKMLSAESFPWKLPPITELKGSPQKRKYSSVPFMPLGFYGKEPEGTTYFCACTVGIGNSEYPGVLLELPLLLNTEEYRRKVLAVHFPGQIIPTISGACSENMRIEGSRRALPSSE